MEPCIYIFTSPSNKSYVGQTINFERRRIEHLYSSRQGNTYPIHCAIRKYGLENFQIEVIPCEEKELNLFEKFYIGILKGIGEVYNCNSGGDQYKVISQETRDKLSKVAKGRKMPPEHKEKLRALRLADPDLVYKMKQMSLRSNLDEFKTKRTLANTGRKHSEETKRKIGAASSLRNSGSGNPNYKPELHG